MNYIKKRGQSLTYALSGLKAALQESNFKLQSIMGLIAILCGFLFNISRMEWCFIIACCGLVLALELLNSAIERVCDTLTSDFNHNIKFIKDVCAGAVLIASGCAATIGFIIFGPYIKQYFS
ncbi:MAG: diacylglycerol kinase [Bacteroidetes bacterium]|nr:diacylglycerol kinase [Bacteroidota bacterium]